MDDLRIGVVAKPKKINQTVLFQFLERNINHNISFRIGNYWHRGMVLEVDRELKKFKYRPADLPSPTWMEYRHIVQYDAAHE